MKKLCFKMVEHVKKGQNINIIVLCLSLKVGTFLKNVTFLVAYNFVILKKA